MPYAAPAARCLESALSEQGSVIHVGVAREARCWSNRTVSASTISRGVIADYARGLKSPGGRNPRRSLITTQNAFRFIRAP